MTDPTILPFELDSIGIWRNARTNFDQGELRELANSLLDSGEALEFPIGYLTQDGEPEAVHLFSGERRLRAYRMLRDEGHDDFASMMVRVVPRPSEADLHKRALAVNLQRVNLKPSEAGGELVRMMGLVDEGSGLPLWTMRSLAEELAKPVSWVSSAMTLTKAPESVREAVDADVCAMEVGALVGTLPPGLREGAAAEMVHGPMGAMSREQARMWVGERYRRDLRQAAFSVDESGLAGKPACVRCEWWGGIREDVEGKNAGTVCLNPGCFLEKQKEAVVLRAQEKGAQLSLWDEVEGPGIWEAHSGRLSPDSGYVELSEKPSPQVLDVEITGSMVVPTWGDVLKDSGLVPMVAFDLMGQPRELVRVGDALRAAASSSWGSMFRDGAVGLYLSPEERAAERAVRAATDRETGEVLLEGLAEFRRGLEACGEPYGLIREAVRYILGALVKAEDVTLLGSVFGASGKSAAAVEEVMTDGPTALVLALLVRRMRYEGFGMMLEDEESPLVALARMAGFDAASWHRQQERRRMAAQIEARAAEDERMKASAKHQAEMARAMRAGR